MVLSRNLCHRHSDDRIHMHFHNSPTDTAPQCTHLRSKPQQYHTTVEPLRCCAKYTWLSDRFLLQSVKSTSRRNTVTGCSWLLTRSLSHLASRSRLGVLMGDQAEAFDGGKHFTTLSTLHTATCAAYRPTVAEFSTSLSKRPTVFWLCEMIWFDNAGKVAPRASTHLSLWREVLGHRAVFNVSHVSCAAGGSS